MGGYKIVIAKHQPSPQYPDDGYMLWITDRDTNAGVLDSSMQYHDGDFGDPLEPGRKYYFSVTAVCNGTGIMGNSVELEYPDPDTHGGDDHSQEG